MRLVLASASPRRADLLEAAGFVFEADPAHVDERVVAGESAHEHVARLSRAKACAVAARRPGDCVLGADTVVVVDREILGKPVDDADAARMLRTLSGRSHLVMTGVCLAEGERVRQSVSTTEVWVGLMTDADIAWYVATGEPHDKAGAYAIQGLASRFVTRIVGSYSNVVGLPVSLVATLLAEFKFPTI